MALARAWHKPDNVAGSAAPAIMIGLFVAFGGILFGYDTGTITGIIAMNWWKQNFSTGWVDEYGMLGMSPSQQGEIVSILSAGTFFGALGAAPFADQMGRRATLIFATAVFTFGVVLQTASMALPMFLAGRLFAGFGVGIISVLIPLYQSEMAPKWIRGALVCAYQLAITFGLLVAAIVNYVTSSIDSPACFRIPVSLQFIWAGILMFGLIILPETPRYLIKRGLHGAAAASLSRIRRLDITHPALIEEIAEIEANHAYELSLGPATYRDIFMGSPRLGRRLLTGCVLQMLQQLSGCNFIFYYGVTYYRRAGIGNEFIFQMVSNIVNVVSSFPGMILVESVGRRKLLMIGATGMALSQFIVASVSSSVMAEEWIAKQVILAFIYIYIFFFASSWGPVVWVVTSEIYPLKVRAKSMSVSTASNWLLNWAISYSTPYMLGEGEGYLDLGGKIFFVWASCNLVAFFFVWFMVFETSKISLEQIDELYERVDHAWRSTNFQPSWSFQDIQEETVATGASGVSLADREAARRRSGTTTSDSADSDRISSSVNGTGSTTSSTTAGMTAEDKIVASLGHVDFSL